VTSHLVVGTAGHIDHGKSTLVHALTGTDPDRLKEEKARGITIDLGFAHWRRGNVTVAFVDVPGHERFVKNMLAGAGGIDAVLLVVAADEGVMPQTREHFEICRLLGIGSGVVAITKSDLVDDETLDLVKLDVADLVRGSLLERASVVTVSARTGAGLIDLESALVALVGDARPHLDDGAVRLPVDRVFSMRGFGTVVTGTLVSGRVPREADLEVQPGGGRVKVRGVQVHGEMRAEAGAGERVALNLASIDVGGLQRGQVLVTPGTLASWTVLDVVVEIIPGAHALSQGARVRFHQGTTEVLARVSIAGPAATPGRTPAIPPGERGYARLRLESPAALTRGDRFVVRSYSPATTIGGGWILDPMPGRRGVRSLATVDRLERLARPFLEADTGERELEALAVFVEDAGPAGLSPDTLTTRCGVSRLATERHAAALIAAGRAEGVGNGVLVGPEWRAQLTKRVVEALEAHHRAHPLSEGLPREELRERVLAGVHPLLAESLLETLVLSGRSTGRDRVALAGRGPSLSQEEAAAAAAIERVCVDGGLAPADPAEIAKSLGLTPTLVTRVSGFLVRQQVLVRLGGLLFHRDALARLRRDVAALKDAEGAGATVDVATFKKRFGLTRKYAIPLLEYLDRERVTRRTGDTRLVL
jgi:selenocysteine-specific elongation factor